MYVQDCERRVKHEIVCSIFAHKANANNVNDERVMKRVENHHNKNRMPEEIEHLRCLSNLYTIYIYADVSWVHSTLNTVSVCVFVCARVMLGTLYRRRD